MTMVELCDLCGEQIKPQTTTYRGQFRRWPWTRREPVKDLTICDVCWAHMWSYIRGKLKEQKQHD